jgi:hypothetical protein
MDLGSAGEPLDGASLNEEDQIDLEQPRESLLVKDQEVIQACSPHTPQNTFTDGIRLGSLVRRSKDFDASCSRHARKTWPDCAVILSNHIAWPFSIRRCFSHLLCDPEIDRDTLHMDHLPPLQRGCRRRQKADARRDPSLASASQAPPPTSLQHDCVGTFSRSAHRLEMARTCRISLWMVRLTSPDIQFEQLATNTLTPTVGFLLPSP